MKNFKFLLLPALCLAFMATSYGQLKVDMNGDVGVGTTTPSTSLEVVRNGFAGFFLKSETAAAQFRFRAAIGTFVFDDAAGTQKALFGYNEAFNRLSMTSNTSAAIALQTNGNFVWWDPSGRLGVNTTAPGRNLQVVGNAGKTDGNSMWDILSDSRLKKDVSDYKEGLDKLMQIRPVTFRYNGKAGTNTEKKVVGVIAQEIKEILPHMVSNYDYYPVEEIKYQGTEHEEVVHGAKETYLSYNSSDLQYILVNSIKEQQEIIETQNKEIDELEERLSRLESLLSNTGNPTIGNDAIQTVELSSEGTLAQNQPNPFDHQTLIKYTLPKNTQNAVMLFTDNSGRSVKQVTLDSSSQYGQLHIKARELNAGTYTYTLMIDGRVFSSKQMILTN